MTAVPPHPDRLLGLDPAARMLARELYAAVADAPIISPHGHVNAEMLATNRPFADPAELFVTLTTTSRDCCTARASSSKAWGWAN